MSELNSVDANTSPDVPETPETPSHKPVLRVVKGDLTPEELAALVAVVAARNAAAAHAAANASKPSPRSAWGHPAKAHRRAHVAGPGQWRQSSWLS